MSQPPKCPRCGVRHPQVSPATGQPIKGTP